MKHIVVGTAGHIDHGKTTLIKALTGRETDTLEEEKKRGISINLGFTYFDLPSKKTVGIVDVPGHEKFIKNMLAGAAGLDVVLLVVAADEGMMPQTIEHINILSYLSIKNGIVVITKADTVDEEMLDLAIEDIKDGLAGTFLGNADMIVVDSVSKRGIDELILKLDELTEEVEEKNDSLPARINVDRVFSVKGFGTVVTGTIMEGRISVNDELEIYPSNKKAIVRNIQVHGENVEIAYAGQRTAINLANVKVTDIDRGYILAEKNSMLTSMMIDVKIKLLKHPRCKIDNWDRLKLYHGTKEILCRAVPLEKENMVAGEEGFVQLRLEEEIVCKKLDPFVIRTYSPMDTIGGGVIIDISTEKHGINKYTEKVIEELRIKESGDDKEVLTIYLKNNSCSYPKISDMTSYIGLTRERVEDILTTLEKEGIVIDINGKKMHIDHLNLLERKMMKILHLYHKEFNLRSGIPKHELANKIDASFKTKDIDSFLDIEVQNNKIKVVNNIVSLKDFYVDLSDEEIAIKENLLKELDLLGFGDIKNIEEISNGDRKRRAVLESMIGDEVLLLDAENIISTKLYNCAKDMLIDYIKTNGEITLGEFRDMMKSSRKVSMIILEDFDKNKITKRVESKRVLV